MEILGYAIILIDFLLIVWPFLVMIVSPVVILATALVAGIFLLVRGNELIETEQKTWKVLVADDDEVSTLPLIFALSKEPVEISYATTGKEALDSLKNNQFDLVFLDLMLPDMNGSDVLTGSDLDYENKSKTPVIVYSGSSDEEGISTLSFNNFEVKDFWKKKLDPLDLKQKLDSVFANVS